MTRLPGSTLGPYEIVALLGAGGMGEVYRARDPRIGREVALKLISGEATPDHLRRFELEARAAGALNHPNVLAVYDVGSADDRPYLVSELLEGETLRARLLRGALPQGKVIELGVQLCRGLAAAHDKHILHRDLKPDNLFITRDGRLKILDFGLAKPMAAMPLDGTSSGIIVGTVGYMSPEQVRGEPLDARSDLFALGAVLHEMLTGKRAFAGDSAVEVLNAILKDEPPALPSSALGPVLGRCLAKQRDERFQSARDLAFALELAARAGDAPVAGTPKGRRRLWLLAALAVVAAAALLIGVLGATTQAPSRPTFQQLSYREQSLDLARFSPDGETIYATTDTGRMDFRIQAFTRGSPEARRVGPPSSLLLSVSRRGELAIMLDPQVYNLCGTIARMPPDGGAPRRIVDNGCDAAWLPDGEDLAVIRAVEGHNVVELPIGHEIHRTTGFANYLRVSPDGGSVAFLRDVSVGLQGVELVVVNAAGETRSLAHLPREAAYTWSPGGELIVPLSGPGPATELRAITPAGEQRNLMTLIGSFTVSDVAKDGTVLLARQEWRQVIRGRAPGENRELDFSWFASSVLTDVSYDGTKLLFYELSDERGVRAYYLEPGQGDPVWLGMGFTASLSPDGHRALMLPSDGAGNTVMVVPIGAGEPERIVFEGLGEILDPRWLVDGKGFVFTAVAEGQPRRLYLRDAGGAVRAFGPPAVRPWLLAKPVSPYGDVVFARTPDGGAVLVSLEGDEVTPVRGLRRDDRFAQFSSDGRLLIYDGVATPCSIEVLTPQDGARRTIGTIDVQGGQLLRGIFLSADLESYYYTMKLFRGELYLASGLL